jgi:large subunit ribosomal protein L21
MSRWFGGCESQTPTINNHLLLHQLVVLPMLRRACLAARPLLRPSLAAARPLLLLRPNLAFIPRVRSAPSASALAPGLPAARRLSSKLSVPEGVVGPEHLQDKAGSFSAAEVDEIEEWCLVMSRASALPHVKPLLEAFLKQKLGPQYRAMWRQLQGSRLATLKRQQELAAKRPPPSTHFKVTHASEQAAAAEESKVFAVVALAGSQFKVTEGDVLAVNKLDAQVGDKLRLDQILLVGAAQKTLIGRPLVPDVVVHVGVEQQTMESKVLAFHKTPKRASQKIRGSRRHVTVLRVEKIEMGPQVFL